MKGNKKVMAMTGLLLLFGSGGAISETACSEENSYVKEYSFCVSADAEPEVPSVIEVDGNLYDLTDYAVVKMSISRELIVRTEYTEGEEPSFETEEWIDGEEYLYLSSEYINLERTRTLLPAERTCVYWKGEEIPDSCTASVTDPVSGLEIFGEISLSEVSEAEAEWRPGAFQTVFLFAGYMDDDTEYDIDGTMVGAAEGYSFSEEESKALALACGENPDLVRVDSMSWSKEAYMDASGNPVREALLWGDRIWEKETAVYRGEIAAEDPQIILREDRYCADSEMVRADVTAVYEKREESLVVEEVSVGELSASEAGYLRQEETDEADILPKEKEEQEKTKDASDLLQESGKEDGEKTEDASDLPQESGKEDEEKAEDASDLPQESGKEEGEKAEDTDVLLRESEEEKREENRSESRKGTESAETENSDSDPADKASQDGNTARLLLPDLLEKAAGTVIVLTGILLFIRKKFRGEK